MSQTTRESLASFAETGDEAAFRRVVDEFGGLVLRAAYRRTGEQGAAEEVAQNVFAIMARKARRVAKHASIAGWVFTTVRLEAAKALRGRQRHRRKLEALAEELNTSPDMSDDELEQWRDALPHLEASLDRLGDSDREVLLARFFEGKSFAEIAGETGKSEAACKMRVRRSLDKLNGWMARRGVTVSATVLAAGLSVEWVKAAPSVVSTALSTKAVAAAPGLGAGTVLSNTLLTMSAVKTAGVAAAAILAIGAVPVMVQHAEATALKEGAATLREQVAARGERDPGAPSGLGAEGARSTPARNFLAGAVAPSDPQAFVEQLLAAVMEQNMVAMIKSLVALGKMSPEEIESLIDEVRDSKASGPGKQMVIPMLMAFAAADSDDPSAVLDKAIAEGVNLTSLMSKLASWAEEDPAAALAWFRARRDAGDLDGKGVGETSERYALMALLPALAKSDPQGLQSLLAEVPDDWRQEALSSVIGATLMDGDEGRARGREMLVAIENQEERLAVFRWAMGRTVGGMELDEAAVFARGLEFDGGDLSRALGAIADARRELPIGERSQWLVRQLGDGPADGARTFVAGLGRGGRRSAEVTAWVNSLPAGAFRDNAILGEIDGLLSMRSTQPQAFARAQQLTDADQREMILGKVLAIWSNLDREAATAAAEEAGLSVPGVGLDQ